ncbi:RNA polymerase sigma factor [Amycolatopsis sp. NBC_01488]|uniref:RNA polymerase sigma factor n=1 Tax=Amycolatopsis sp. NBC_01488 TaxID=2903563 RepID=UPI002E2D3D0C|nr:RNA polymerase sigma factor [Amycolatopsis sp. NBC_01488]
MHGELDDNAVGRIFRAESGRSVATLIRVFGDIDLAEDAVQEAFATALRKWPADGLPPNPGGWITTTARNHAIDRLRRETRGRELLGEAAALSPGAEISPIPREPVAVEDDRLGLIFTCCHPALSPDAQIALTLQLLGGLPIEEIARSFLVSTLAMAQRLARAKRKIKAARIPYRVPEEHELPTRLPPVLAVIYLLYTAGADGPAGPGLCHEAIRLARILAAAMPGEPEVAGLLALVLLSDSRRPARTRPDGSLVVLSEQDRSRWDRALIEEGQAILRWCLHHNRPGTYQLQAAINAVHADAITADQTDWPQIITLYDHLLTLAPTPVVALNRAVAIAEVHGPAAALSLVDALNLDSYHPFHATRADLLQRLGRTEDAMAAFERAANLAPTEAERNFLRLGGRAGTRRGGVG